MTLASHWIRHLDPSDPDTRKNFETAVRNSTTALNRLRDILREDLESLDKSETTEGQFEDPNWPFKQSYRNGQRSKLRQLISILEFDPK